MGSVELTLISIDSAPSSDAWGFVGVVRVGSYEAYRTIRAYPTPRDALSAGERLLGEVLGALMAGQEWRTAADEFGHAPRRTELGLGLPPPEEGVDDHRHERPDERRNERGNAGRDEHGDGRRFAQAPLARHPRSAGDPEQS